MGILASDNFNRANENPLGNGVWTTGSGNAAMQIVSNQATPTDLSVTNDGSYYSGISWPANQYSKAKLTVNSTLGSTRGPGLFVRQQSGADTKYMLITDHAASNNVTLVRISAGVFTNLTGFPLTQAWTDGDTWELRVVGTTLSVWRNGIQVGPNVTDSSITSGSPGIGLSTDVTSAAIDDWEGGTPDSTGLVPVVDKPLTLLRCRPLGPGNPLREVKYYESPPVVVGVTVVTDVGALQLDGFSPAIGLPKTIVPDVGSLSLAGFSPQLPTTIVPGSGALTLAGFSATFPKTIVPGLGQLSLIGFSATFPRTIVPATGALDLTGFAPQFARTILPGFGQLTLAGLAPSLSFVAGSYTAQPGFGVLSLAGLEPTIGLPKTVQPAFGVADLSGYAPAIGLPITIRPANGALTLSGFSPTISFIPPGIFILPGVGNLTLTGYAPFIGSFTMRFAGGPVMTAEVNGGNVFIASWNGGPVLTGTIEGEPT
jgi:hypothetical protein